MTSTRIRLFGLFMLLTFIVGWPSSSIVSHNQVHNTIPHDQHNHDASQFADDQEEYGDFDEDEEDGQDSSSLLPAKKVIKDIIIEGNVHVPTEAIISRIPYTVGEIFNPQKTNALLNNVHALGYFKHVQVLGEDIDDRSMNLVVIVQEKKLLDEVIFEGNKHLSKKDMEKKINFEEIYAIDEEDIPRYVAILKKLYRDKDYHNVEIFPELKIVGDKATLIFTIKEHAKTAVKRVFFEGNCHVTSKKLRSIIFTREDWILGFMDRAGSYQPDAIEADKHVIENFYQSIGFFNAKVIDVKKDFDPVTKNVNVTFYIHEGDIYTISDIKVPGNDIIPEERLCNALPIKVGDVYSKDKIRQTIEALRTLWGDFGYIYADIEPSVQPNDETKTVELGFYTELGPQVILNRINIIGNIKTHDKVIRRVIALEEGCLLTSKGMDDAKSRVESLGYFDTRDGVSWKINRIGKDKADLELYVKEVKTGKVEGQIGFNGSPRDYSSPMRSLTVRGAVYDSNLFGRGINFNLSTELSKEERNLAAVITQPWLFDRPIYASADLEFKRSLYDEFSLIQGTDIFERITSGGFTLGFVSRKAWDSRLSARIGMDGITYPQPPRASELLPPDERAEFQNILNKRFVEGPLPSIAGIWAKDVRNHPLHPSRGYQWLVQSRAGFSAGTKNSAPLIVINNNKFGYFKLDADMSWYTPLIGERDLVFCLHGHFGFIIPFKNRTIPFRELYHIGGPASVRGYLYGEIGPVFRSLVAQDRSNLLGGKKGFWLNAELIFPISGDFSFKGAFFYDGGAGWDTPDADEINPARLKNNDFSYRHAVGFGIRVLKPTPMKIDWGFKLNRKKGEHESEVHFTAYHEF